jgi:hypothetical protein
MGSTKAAPSPTAFKVRENLARRAAGRQGLFLRKSRRRDPMAVDYGGYWLVDLRQNTLVFGGELGAELEAVEQWLAGDRP